MGVISRYCSDDEIVNHLRLYFDEHEQYTFPFKSWLHTARRTDEGILLTMGTRKFLIHEETGAVLKEVF